VYRLGVLWGLSSILDRPGLIRLTWVSRNSAGQGLVLGVLCKQGVGGSSPLVSTEVVQDRRASDAFRIVLPRP
jgi:hypothetical protein